MSAHVNLGLLYVQMGQADRAISQLQEALRLDPDRSDAATALVNVWRDQARDALSANDPQKALSILLQARKLAPANADVQFELGMVALRMSLLPDAVTAFHQSLKLRPDDPLLSMHLGALIFSWQSSKTRVSSLHAMSSYVRTTPPGTMGWG